MPVHAERLLIGQGWVGHPQGVAEPMCELGYTLFVGDTVDDMSEKVNQAEENHAEKYPEQGPGNRFLEMDHMVVSTGNFQIEVEKNKNNHQKSGEKQNFVQIHHVGF